jgi:AraC-like DNA-binding protein
MPAHDSVHVTVRQPCAALRPFVQGFVAVDCTAGHADAHWPGTGLVAAFRLRGECRLDYGGQAPRAGLTGLFERERRHLHGAGNLMALVRFTPIGAAAFFRHPLHELANATVALQDVADDTTAFDALSEQLMQAAGSVQDCLERLEAFFLARLGNTAIDPLAAAAVNWIGRAGPDVRIAALVRQAGVSHSALERRFRQAVGVSPKRFARLVRLQRVMRLHAGGASLTALAQDAGYFDQSHFIKDFKQVTGLAPQAYFAQAEFLQAGSPRRH